MKYPSTGMPLLLLALWMFIVLGGFVTSKQIPKTAPFDVPQGVKLLDIQEKESGCPGYILTVLDNESAGYVAVWAKSGFRISKKGMSYQDVFLAPGEEANVRRASDQKVVAQIANVSHQRERILGGEL